MNLLLLEPEEIDGSGHATVAGVRARHLRRVLGVDAGAQIRVGVVDGPAGRATVVSCAGDDVVLRCALDGPTPPRPRVDLLLALPRPKVMRRLWPQLAALGVGQVVVTNAHRVERNYFDTHVLDPASYRPLLVEGLQQARDTRLPLVSVHRRFKVLVEDDLDGLFSAGVRLVAHPGEVAPGGPALGEGPGERVLVAVGPEGGWTEFELRLLGAHGFRTVSAGPRTLRTDTACVALLTLVHAGLSRPVT